MFSNAFNGAKEDVHQNGKHLFNLGDFAGISLGSNLVPNEDIKQILTRSGTLAPTIEFRPSQSFKSRVKTKERLPSTFKIEELQNWFSELLQDNGETFYLVPDTNFLVNCYYSNYFKAATISNKLRLQFLLPRIVNLELERRASSKEDSRVLTIDEIVRKLDLLLGEVEALVDKEFKKTSDGKYDTDGAHVLESKVTKAKENLDVVNRQLKRKRISFLAMSEIYSMMSDGAQNMLQTTYPILFLKNEGLPDALIRMEIKDNLQNNSPHNYIFMTSDFTNALAASAENLNTMYFHQTDSIRGEFADKIQKILYHTAIQFGECDIMMPDSAIRLLGMWEGKNQSDWSDNIVQITIAPRPSA